MPQDRLRSVVYRSFVTCDDPKGVVDCGTFRKYKNGPQKMKHKVEGHQQASDMSNRSLSLEREEMGSMRITEEFHTSSSLQLLEVSRGAEKLNQMIGSWSRRRSFDGQSEDFVAKDLLKGALDLQESLVMLGKLQEASKYMARLKKQKEKNKVDEVGIERSRSDRFMSQNNYGDSQKHRLSVDGPPRDCIEQLREAIRDSFSRQNLLHQKDLDSGFIEMPSTSSSQSSTNHCDSNRFGSSVSSLSPAAPQKISKGTNLIAKLMGLEEIPSKSKPVKAKSKQTPIQLKPIYGNDSMKGLKPQPCRLSDVDDSPPIVLLKPARAQWQDSEFESLGPTYQEEESLSKKIFPRKLKTKHEHRPKIVSCEERVLNKKTLRKEVPRETLARKLSEEVHSDLKVKALGHINHREEKNEAIDKRVDKIQKKASSKTKPVEKETVKCRTLSRSQDQARMTKTKLGKSENGSDVGKLQNLGKHNTAPHHISKNRKQTITGSSSGHKKNQVEKEKSREKPVSAETITENSVWQEDKTINPTSENNSAEKETNVTLTDKLTTEEETDAYNLQIEEKDCTVDPEHEKDMGTAKDLDNDCHKIADSKDSRTQTKLEAFLLSSLSFLSHVEQLFDLNVSFPLVSQASDTNNFGVASEALSLDFANEFVKRRSLPDSRMIDPLLLTYTGNTRICISLDRLMEEVCNAVETLENYTNPATDNVYAILERDAHSNGVVNGTWDMGWRHGFSVDEAEQVVNDLEKLLLSGLIEEAFAFA